LGDFALSFPAFAAIRAHHAQDHITLLTTRPFVSLAQDSPWFDDIRVDTRPSWFDPVGIWRLRGQLRGFDFVYDLQTSRRSSRYFGLAGRPPWSGIAAGCSNPDRNPDRNALHTVERQQGQLRDAGITVFPAPALAWLEKCGKRLEPPYALVVPGTSPSHGGAKRWPVERFAAIATLLAARGITPVVIGGSGDAALAASIRAACPSARDMTGQTSLQDLAGIASRAAVTIGGDTGPVHLAAVAGSPVVALFSRYSIPAQAAPRGPQVTLLQEDVLTDLSVQRVAAAVAWL
jgi:ADP-heptose:LPS heptosyltransferase